MSGFFQEVQFADNTPVVELWLHFWCVMVLVQDGCRQCWCVMCFSIVLHMQVTNDRVNQLQLCQLYGSIGTLGDLDP